MVRVSWPPPEVIVDVHVDCDDGDAGVEDTIAVNRYVLGRPTGLLL